MSTLVYALETLDCSDHFSVIFPLALSDRWDVVISALNILQEQSFNLTEADIAKAQKILADSDVAKESARARRILGSLLKKLSRNIHKVPCAPRQKNNSKA